MYYTGYTSDVARRCKEHTTGQKCKLVYYESYLTQELARERKRKLKQYGGRGGL